MSVATEAFVVMHVYVDGSSVTAPTGVAATYDAACALAFDVMTDALDETTNVHWTIDRSHEDCVVRFVATGEISDEVRIVRTTYYA